ncbi:MAG TPA: hypothetical protein PLD88_09145 [Candidatus Berkiella sp.]|nr:hypothetical protein [Candidatus Berkiella sp.]
MYIERESGIPVCDWYNQIVQNQTGNSSMTFKSSLKLSLLIALASSSSLIRADNEVISNPYINRLEGLNMGASVGGTSFFANKLKHNTQVGTLISAGNNQVYNSGMMANIFLGNNWISSNGYFTGVELGFNLFGENELTMRDSANVNATVLATAVIPEDSGSVTLNDMLATQTKITRHFLEPYFDVKLGFLPRPDALLYLRGGINYNQLAIRNNVSYNVADSALNFGNGNSLNTNSAISVKTHRDKIGFRVGTGMEYLITPQIGLGANYVYTLYARISNNNTATVPVVVCDALESCVISDDTAETNSNTRVHDQEAMIQLIYHFGL